MSELKDYKESLDYIRALYSILVADYTARVTGQKPALDIKALASEMDRFDAVVNLLKDAIPPPASKGEEKKDTHLSLDELKQRLDMMEEYPNFEEYLAGAGMNLDRMYGPAAASEILRLRAEAQALKDKGVDYYRLFAAGTKDPIIIQRTNEADKVSDEFYRLGSLPKLKDFDLDDPDLPFADMPRVFSEVTGGQIAYFMAGYGVTADMIMKPEFDTLLKSIYEKYADLGSAYEGFDYDLMIYLWEGMRTRAEDDKATPK